MTGQGNDRQQYRHENHYEEDEINLIDLLRVIWKWKWLIIAGVVICVVTAAVISFRMPRIYEVSMYIEPGIVGVNKENGNFLYIDSPADISGKIRGGVYNQKLEAMFHLGLHNKVDFKSSPLKNSNPIKITSRWKEGETGLGMKVSLQLLTLVTNDYDKVIQSMKDDYEKQIALTLNRIESLQSQIKLKRAMGMKVKRREQELMEEIKRVKGNTDKILQQRDKVMQQIELHENTDTETSLSLILYSTIIQQGMSYFNALKDNLYELEVHGKELEAASLNLGDRLDEAQMEMDMLKLKKGLISNIKIIQQPEVSPNPVAPKKKQIILLAGVVSLFMFIFLAFFIEYVRNSMRIKHNTQDAVVKD